MAARLGALDQNWLQGAIWSNQHVREAVTAMKEKREARFPAFATRKSLVKLAYSPHK